MHPDALISLSITLATFGVTLLWIVGFIRITDLLPYAGRSSNIKPHEKGDNAVEKKAQPIRIEVK